MMSWGPQCTYLIENSTTSIGVISQVIYQGLIFLLSIPFNRTNCLNDCKVVAKQSDTYLEKESVEFC